jgi:hypothetical protein
MAWLPSNTWLQGQLTDKVNLNQTCNAYWDGTAVNFFKSGGGCSNTGELPTVFLHEVGHGLDSNDGSPSSTVGSSESYGDINGIMATHDSCLGVNFFTNGTKCSGYGNACTSCTGIRDADYAKHSSQTPCTPSQLSGTTGYHCSKNSSYPGPCGYEGHCESYIMSEVGWDLAARDLPAAGYDANTSWFIADRLFYLTRPTSGDSYACPSVTTTNGCSSSNWFQTYMVADDDNGNLSDGTPHAAAIYNAFNRHAIACSSTVHTNSTTCGTIGQPTLTATAGTGSVALSWTAASGASKYMVLRNEISASAGMMVLATVTSGTSYTDSVVAPGITYYYAVLGVGSSNSCFGALSAVKSATPSAGATYSISGTVSGAVASGVTMTLSGAASATTTTGTGGTYTFSGLANGSYTVTPSLSGYTFSPASTNVTVSGANVTGINFTSTAATTYSISGTVSGAVASGVTMTLSGTASATTTTGTGGTYTFSGLANGSYTVTPSLSGYTFSPASTNVTVSGANVTGINFTSAAVSGDTPLTSGVGVSTGSIAQGAWKYYTIAVPSGATNLSVTLTNLTADLDLYVNNSTTHPTTSSYYGRSWNGGTTSESLSWTNPTVATWCIGVYGYAAGSGTVTATVTTGGGSTTLFSNGFESSTGWAQVDTSGTAGTWSLVTSGTYPTCSVHGGSYMAKFNSYDASSGSATRYYRTSGFAISSSYTTVTLTFWMYHDTGYSSYADKIQPQVSTDGSTWVNLGSAINRYDGSTGWKQHTLSLTTYKGSTVYLGFLATSAYGNNMYLDDVLVVAQ